MMEAMVERVERKVNGGPDGLKSNIISKSSRNQSMMQKAIVPLSVSTSWHG
jgi:hypothetical protein